MNVHDFSVNTASGDTVSLADYAGKVLLIVNVASKCGLTPQYEGLEALHRQYADRGLAVLGFPCNQFAGQEPATDAEIQDFCSTQYSVTFPVFAKLDVNDDDADPLFQYLRAAAPGDVNGEDPANERLFGFVAKAYPAWMGTDAVKWNFNKFLVGRDGEVIRRYEPPVEPAAIAADLDALLG